MYIYKIFNLLKTIKIPIKTLNYIYYNLTFKPELFEQKLPKSYIGNMHLIKNLGKPSIF